MDLKSRKPFDYLLDFKKIDFRKHPELYRVGRGEQGVLLVEPYKSELLPYWKFRTPEIAKKSASAIHGLFLEYKKQEDFVGMDMARKFLQMGYTRSRRYANHASGRKYETNPQREKTSEDMRHARANVRPQEKDWAMNEKAKSARIFYAYYRKAKDDKKYRALMARHELMNQ